VEDFLPSIWLYCDVGPSPNTSSLSVSFVSMHATLMTFILHTYLHHFSAFLHFLMFAYKVACLGCFHFQKQVWACHLSNRLSPIKQNKHILPSVPHRVHFSWKKVVSVSPLKKDEKIPSRVRSSLGIKSCLTVSLRFIPGQNLVFIRSKSGFPSMIARVYLQIVSNSLVIRAAYIFSNSCSSS